MVLSMPPTTGGETESLVRLSDLLQVELGSDVQDGLEVRGREISQTPVGAYERC